MMTAEIRIRMNGHDRAFSTAEGVRIGRDPTENDLYTENQLVSRRHAYLHAKGDRWTMEDMGSRHGIYLAGNRVNRVSVDGTSTVWLGPPGLGQLLQLIPSSVADFSPSAVFISYRRGDGAGYAMVLNERLVAHFGSARVFRDIDDLGPGTNFVARIESAIGSCAVVIALMGTNWAGGRPDGRRRLDDPNDFLRLEVVSAIQLGVRIIPVLVQGASMPTRAELPEPIKALASRQALRIDDSAVEFGLSQLIAAVERELGEADATPNPPRQEPSRPAADTAPGPPARPTGDQVGWGWWLLPVFLQLIGGVIAWAGVRKRNPERAAWLLIAGIISTIVWAIATGY